MAKKLSQKEIAANTRILDSYRMEGTTGIFHILGDLGKQQNMELVLTEEKEALEKDQKAKVWTFPVTRNAAGEICWDLSTAAEQLMECVDKNLQLQISYDTAGGKKKVNLKPEDKKRKHTLRGTMDAMTSKGKMTLIPYMGTRSFFFFHVTSEGMQREDEIYLRDAMPIARMLFTELTEENQGLQVTLDQESWTDPGQESTDEETGLDQKEQYSNQMVLDQMEMAQLVLVERTAGKVYRYAKALEELKQGALKIPVGDLIENQNGGSLRIRYAIYLEIILKDGEQRIYRLQEKDFHQKEANYVRPWKLQDYNRSFRYDTPFEIGTAKNEKDEDYTVCAVPYLEEMSGWLRIMTVPKEDAYMEQQEAVVQNIKVTERRLTLWLTYEKSEKELGQVYISLRNALQPKKYQLTLDKKILPGGRRAVKAWIDLDTIEFEQFYWDIDGTWIVDGEEYRARLTNRRKILSRSLYLRHMEYNRDNGFFAYPYRKKSKEFALHYRMKTKEDTRSFVTKEYLALFVYLILKPYWDRKKIWIVYEKYCQMAQDNGYYFFKYCMEHLPEEEKKHIYYVIDQNAPDYEVVKPYGKRVIDFLSFRHMVYLVAAELLISSDTKAHAYAWHSPNSVYRNRMYKKENIFLQHGVMAFKCCHKGLRKGGTNPASIFITSSEVEADIIEQYFEYKREDIAVTGLARWDVLQDKADPAHKEILLMPTWRTWLEEVQKEEFVQSDYYQHYMSFLNQPELSQLLEKNQITMNFYIHPKFREYLDEFTVDSQWIRLIPFGSEPLNELIMRCSMMITDYSSACWDVYYQGKPVLFYLFDLELYNEVQGSYIDMETEAFGDTTRDSRQLLELMEAYIQNGFREKEQYAQQRERLLPYRDDQNSKRTYDIIKKRGW